MSRTTAGTHGVNLMPLLDVLLCTMGTLIVILGVINREARFHPAKRLPGKAVAAAEQREQMIEAREDLQLRVQELTTAREKTLADLDTSRARLADVEDTSRQLEDQLHSLAAAAKQLPAAGASDDPQRDQLRMQLMQLNTQRMQLEKDLERSRADSAHRQPAYSVVPFEGMYKTNRRPIYIECRGDSVILQPEGIMFGPQDFLGPGGPSNPLASALRAAQEYWRNAPRPAPDLPNEPYPLLLVRPDGIIAYYLVRDAMSSWDAQFGYELVGQDWKLDFPMQPEPQLKDQEERAVAEARQQLQWLAQISPELFSRKSSTVQYHVSPIRGGVVRDGGPSLGNDPFAEDPLGGFGRSGGHGNSAMPGLAGGNASGSGGSYGMNGGGGDPGGSNGSGLGNGVGGNLGGGQSGMDGGLADARGNSAFAMGAPGGNGSGQAGYSPGGMGSGELNGGGMGGGGGNGSGEMGSDGLNSGSFGSNSGGGANGSGANGTGGNNASANGGSEVANVGPRYAGTGNSAAGSGYGMANNAGSTSNPANGVSSTANGIRGMNGSRSPSEYGGVLLPGSEGGMMNATGSASSGVDSSGVGSTTGSGSGSPGGQYAASAGPMGSGGPYGNSASPGSAATAGGGGMASASSSGGQSGSDSSSGNGQSGSPFGSSSNDPNMPTGAPSMSFDMSPQQQQSAASLDQSNQQQSSSSSRSMARNRGKNWALPTSHTSSIPIDRPIRVECWSDRLVLVPDTRDQQPQVIPLGQRTEDAVDQLVGAVRTYTKSWGIAGRSMYWKPQLVLNVNPNAEARAADLQTLLGDSGWDVKRR
jgi:hypothetical protein